MSFKVALLPDPLKPPEDFLELIKKTANEPSLFTDLKTEAEVISSCKDTDSIMTTLVRPDRFTPNILKELKKCRFIQTLSVGYEGVDLKVASELGIGIIHLSGFCSEELAEHAMALMLACARWIVGLHNHIKIGEPVPPASPEALNHMSVLRGKTLGIIGFGNSGRALVPKARGFDMKILAYDPYVPQSVFQQMNVEATDFERLILESDFISIHANLTSDTRHMFGLEQFKRMKRSAFIVNTARGGSIDEKALCTALSEGYIAGAGLDVTEIEPPPADSPLLSFDNVILTGHNAGCSPDSHAAMWAIPIEELSRVTRCEWPLGLVNQEVKGKYIARWGEMK